MDETIFLNDLNDQISQRLDILNSLLSIQDKKNQDKISYNLEKHTNTIKKLEKIITLYNNFIDLYDDNNETFNNFANNSEDLIDYISNKKDDITIIKRTEQLDHKINQINTSLNILYQETNELDNILNQELNEITKVIDYEEDYILKVLKNIQILNKHLQLLKNENIDLTKKIIIKNNVKNELLQLQLNITEYKDVLLKELISEDNLIDENVLNLSTDLIK